MQRAVLLRLLLLVSVALAEENGLVSTEAPVDVAVVSSCPDIASNCTEWANAAGGLTGCAKTSGVLLNCAATCEACSMRKTVELATRCASEDQSSDCYAWAKSGQCEVNPGYMIRQCPAACGDYGVRLAWMATRMGVINGCERPEAIPERCADLSGDCEERAKKTLAGCGENIGLLLSCPQTCSACPHYKMIEAATRCENKNDSCELWASQGECGNNTNYMLRHCQYACGDAGVRLAWMGARVAMQQGCTRPGAGAVGDAAAGVDAATDEDAATNEQAGTDEHAATSESLTATDTEEIEEKDEL